MGETRGPPGGSRRCSAQNGHFGSWTQKCHVRHNGYRAMTRSSVAQPRRAHPLSHRQMGSVSFALAVLLVASAMAAVTLSIASKGSATTDPVIGAAGDIACDPGNAAFNGGAGTA